MDLPTPHRVEAAAIEIPPSILFKPVPQTSSVTPALSGLQERIKRIEDILLGIGLLILTALLLIGIGLAIRLTSRGPVMFRQERRGRHNRTFQCFKFRTMYHDYADQDSSEQTRYNDRRVTPVGRFLRRHSLDELPQLFNVVLGDMSLVGPRPHALGTNIDGQLLPDACPDYLHRYQVRPGITGWAQVNGLRGIIDTHEKLASRVEYDLYYISNWSLTLDFKILMKTFTCVIGDERAY